MLDAGGEGLPVKTSGEIMEILEAYGLTGSYRAAVLIMTYGLWAFEPAQRTISAIGAGQIGGVPTDA